MTTLRFLALSIGVALALPCCFSEPKQNTSPMSACGSDADCLNGFECVLDPITRTGQCVEKGTEDADISTSETTDDVDVGVDDDVSQDTNIIMADTAPGTDTSAGSDARQDDMDDDGIEDSTTGADTSVGCEPEASGMGYLLTISGCTAFGRPQHGNPECSDLYDGLEFDTTPILSDFDNECDATRPAPYCHFETPECMGGCFRDFWVRFDLGSEQSLHSMRFMADWWSKRPEGVELWATNDPSNLPGDSSGGAVLITMGNAAEAPWACVHGEPCSSSIVPDECCPNGRDQPQDLESATAKVDEFWPLFDTFEFNASASYRYWYLLVKASQELAPSPEPQTLILHEVQFFSPCPPT